MKTNEWHARISSVEFDALSKGDFSEPTKWVYIALLFYFDQKNGNCWPSIETLCQRTNYTRRTVQKAIKALCEKGLIERKISTDGIKTNTYKRGVQPDMGGASHQTQVGVPLDTGGASHQSRTGVPLDAHNRSINSSNEHNCSESSNNDDIQTEKMVLSFPVKGNVKAWNLGQTKLNEWQELYPDMDVMAECRKALQWLRDNPSRQKTSKGMTKFLNGWLQRSNDQGRYIRRSKPNANNDTSPENSRTFHLRWEIKERLKALNLDDVNPHVFIRNREYDIPIHKAKPSLLAQIREWMEYKRQVESKGIRI